jgi:hypothetical protein
MLPDDEKRTDELFEGNGEWLQPRTLWIIFMAPDLGCSVDEYERPGFLGRESNHLQHVTSQALLLS